jgi:acetyl-CoA synthetase
VGLGLKGIKLMSKIIRVEDKNLGFRPNLGDYSRIYRSFTYEVMGEELTWFEGGKINAAYNAVDRHLSGPLKNKVALYWEGSEGAEFKYTFAELSRLSNRFANLLMRLEVKKGERVFFFLPRLPELFIGFLGTLKRGAVAGTLFSAFGLQALEDRLENSGAKILVTTPELKSRVDAVRKHLPQLEEIIVVDAENRRALLEERELDRSHRQGFYRRLAEESDDYQARAMDPDDPAFMLYTSGTTGKPKGVIHAHRAIIHEHMSAKYVLDLKPEDVYWCTADPGWVTGIAYEMLGNWSNGASTLVYEGRFNPERWYGLIEEYRVTVWYTAPTAVRMLMAAGDDLVKKHDLSSLRHLASVGEPLNPEAVWWSLKVFGYPFHDNWWQTETGGILIANYPAMDIKPGSMGKPLPGITAAIVDDQGRELPVGREGNLAIKPGWPSMMKAVFRRPRKYQSYFVNNWYISGDVAYQDEDGYFWFVGRADDVIKTAGERVGPFEVESALVEHPAIAEAGVIGKPDPLRGEIIKAFIALKPGHRPSEKLKKEIVKFVKKHLAGHAYPREIEFRTNLPKTRSGKIMRRVLKAQELGLPVGDTSTIEAY